jgi:hypothetical protein
LNGAAIQPRALTPPRRRLNSQTSRNVGRGGGWCDGGEIFLKKTTNRYRRKYAMIEKKTDDLLLKFAYFPFKNEQSKHYSEQGFARRIQVLRRCIDNVFKIIPPGTVKVPSKARLHDAQINIQAFLANVYGIVDNLAWIWVYERDLSASIPRRHVGLGKENKAVRSSFGYDGRVVRLPIRFSTCVGTPHTRLHSAWNGPAKER